MKLIMNFEPLQHRDFRDRGIGRYVRHLAAELSRQKGMKIYGVYRSDLDPLEPGLLQLPDVDTVCTSELKTGTFHDDTILLATAATAIPDGKVDTVLQSKFPNLVQAAILYDLIPLIYPQRYLQTPKAQIWYKVGLSRLCKADFILSISSSAASDFCAYFPELSDKVYNVGAGVSPIFRELKNKADPASKSRNNIIKFLGKRAKDGFVMTVGGDNFTKNTENLILAYRSLENSLRRRYPLVLVGSYSDATIVKYGRGAGDIRDEFSESDVYFVRNIEDETLAELYRRAKTFVFPSKYEGFGLPAAEAVTAGAFTIVADIPALSSIVLEPALRFDPNDRMQIASYLYNSLTNDAFRLLKPRADQFNAFRWSEVADKVVQVFSKVAKTGSALDESGLAKKRLRLAMIGPLPPNQSGIADYNVNIVPAMAEYADISFCGTRGSFVTPSLKQDPGKLSIHPAASFLAKSDCSDVSLYIIGNSFHHLHAALLLKMRPGIVWLHDVRLSGLMWDLARFNSVRQPWAYLENELKNHYEPAEVDAALESKKLEDFLNGSLLCTLPIIANARGVIVHSEHAADMLRKELLRLDKVVPIAVVPLAISGADMFSDKLPPKFTCDRDFVIGTVGFIGKVRMPEVLLEAVAILRRTEGIEAEIRFLGHCDPDYRKQLEDISKNLKIRATFSNYIDSDLHYRAELEKLDIVVQVRRHSNGESSATVADCISLKRPVVTNIPSAIEFWSDFLFPVQGVPTSSELATAILTCRSQTFSYAAMSRFGINSIGGRVVAAVEKLSHQHD